MAVLAQPLLVKEKTSKVQSLRQTVIALLFLIAQPLPFYHRVLFEKKSFISFDLQVFHLPLVASIARSVRQGVFPFWTPYSYGGMPLHADIQAQLFYPFTWISILLGNLSEGRKLHYWLEWQIPFHMILAGILTFLLLRELRLEVPSALFGGTAYQLGGFFASQAQHLGAICCAAWLPFLLLCLIKLSQRVSLRWIALLALGVALTILSGFPPGAAVALTTAAVAALCFGLWNRSRTRQYLTGTLGGLTLGIAITWIQIAPTYQLSQESIASLRSRWLLNGGGLPLESLVSLVSPNYYHIFTPFERSYTFPGNFVLLYVYCGIVPLALLIAAFFAGTKARIFAALAAAAAIWMLGEHTPVYTFFYRLLPAAIRGSLYAEFALMAFSLFVSLASAFALSRLPTVMAKTGHAQNRIMWAAALFTAADLIYVGANRPMNSLDGRYKEETSEYELGHYPRALAKVHALTDQVQPPVRMDYLDTDLWTYTNDAELIQIPTMDGNNPFMLKRIYQLRRLFCGGYPWERELPAAKLDSPLLRMMNIEYLGGHSASSRVTLARSGLPHSGEFAGMDIFRLATPLPRFFLTPQVQIAKSQEQAFAFLNHSEFVPEEEAVVEGQISPPKTSGLATGAVTVEGYETNRVDLRAETSGPAFLASSEPMYPGWTATINGKPALLQMTNGAFRGLWLERGSNRITMRYWPPFFTLWALISIVSLLLAMSGVLFGGDIVFSRSPWSRSVRR